MIEIEKYDERGFLRADIVISYMKSSNTIEVAVGDRYKSESINLNGEDIDKIISGLIEMRDLIHDV
jgi:hypothetical protein